MVNSTEALKLALEALITITDAIYVNSQQEADAVYKANDAVKAIKEALAQPEQEPVATLFGSLPVYDTTPPQRTEICCQQYDTCLKPCTPRGERLAKRTWVGLTDEDWKEIEDMPDTFDQGVAWAQAKLKDKNNAT